MWLFGLDKEATCVDISRELGKHFVDSRIVDSHGHSGAACASSVIVGDPVRAVCSI